MPSKKKKFNSRFPPARIKKIMQTDEEVGKVAAAVPVIISRALEMFIETLIVKTGETTQAKNAKTLTATHIKQTIQSEKKFDFLRDLVSSVPDHQAEEEGECSTQGETKKIKRPRKQKEKPQKRGRKKKSSDSSEENSHTSNNGDNPMCDDHVEDEEEDDDEDTETDEEDHSSEYHPSENICHDQSFNASSSNSSGLAQKSNFTSPISHTSSSLVSPYGHNNMPSLGQMLPSTGLNNMPPPTGHLMSQANPSHNMLPPGSYMPPGNTGHNNMPLPPGKMMLHGNSGHNTMALPAGNMMPRANTGHTGMPLPGQLMSPGNKFVPLMPPFPSSGFPPPITINDQNQPLDLCTGSSSKNNNSVQNSEDDDYDT